MKKLRVGVWVNTSMSSAIGGGFTYYSELITNLRDYRFSNANIIYLSNQPYRYSDIDVVHIKWKPNLILKLLKRIGFVLQFFPFAKSIRNFFTNMDHKHLQRLNKELSVHVDIIYYLTPQCVYPNFPFIYTLWDLGHLSTHAFPEVSQNGMFEVRKATHDIIPYKALMVFVESNAGKRDVIHYLRLNPERIKVIPIFPSGIIRNSVSETKPSAIKEGLCFIHYPAQYWAHKNHFNLLLGFKTVLDVFPFLKLVLTGSDHGNKDYVLSTIRDLGLIENVIELGFVTTEELKWVFLYSRGLVMPTFMGPTNMPLLEAAYLNCPVACSDLPGHREQLGEYGYYFDPKNPYDIARQIEKMINVGRNDKNPAFLSRFNINETLASIDDAFKEIYQIRSCWGEYNGIY